MFWFGMNEMTRGGLIEWVELKIRLYLNEQLMDLIFHTKTS